MRFGVGVQVNGGVVLKPAILPEVDTSAMVSSMAVPHPPPLVIGVAEGGDPGKIYTFKTMDEAKAVLRGGLILSYLARIFAPSPDKNSPGASSLKFIRCSSSASRASFSIVTPPPPPPTPPTITITSPTEGFSFTLGSSQQALGTIAPPGGTFRWHVRKTGGVIHSYAVDPIIADGAWTLDLSIFTDQNEGAGEYTLTCSYSSPDQSEWADATVVGHLV